MYPIGTTSFSVYVDPCWANPNVIITNVGTFCTSYFNSATHTISYCIISP
jgi:hypothetical protein